jgi:archaetidylinositol phosphate synthase
VDGRARAALAHLGPAHPARPHAQIGAGLFYALSRYNRYALLLVILCLALNWLGDSLDGTLARVRHHERPRYGFYVDHMADIFGSVALMCGLGFSGFLHWQTAIAMLIAFLMLSARASSPPIRSPASNFRRASSVPRRFAFCSSSATWRCCAIPTRISSATKFCSSIWEEPSQPIGMFAMAIHVTLRHTAQLYRQEPLP